MQRTKNKGFHRNSSSFFKYYYKKELTRKNFGQKASVFAAEFILVCRAEGLKFYLTKNETVAAFAERTIRSLKNALYRCMEDHGFKYSQIVSIRHNPEIQKDCSVDLIPKNVKNSYFFCSVQQTTKRFKKIPGSGLETDYTSRNIAHPSGRVIRHI